MFPASRQSALNPLLDALRKIPGVKEVYQDDFDSAWINVFIVLDTGGSEAGSMTGHKPYRFISPLRSTKAAIKRECKQLGFLFNFLDWPAMQYISQRIGRISRKIKDGYDGSDIKMEVMV